MPRDASGNYSLPAVYLATPGTTVRSEQHNIPLQDLASAMSASLPRDGTAPMTGNLPMGGRRVTGLGAGTAGTDAAQVNQVNAAVANLPPTDITVDSGNTASGGTHTHRITAQAFRGMALTHLSSNEIGSMAFAYYTGATTITFGENTAGTNLRPANTGAVRSPNTLSGFWRCMGYAVTNTSTLWQRIS